MTAEEIKVKNWLQRAFYADKKLKVLDMLLRTSRMHAEGLAGYRQYNGTGKSDTALNDTENAFMRLAATELFFAPAYEGIDGTVEIDGDFDERIYAGGFIFLFHFVY